MRDSFQLLIILSIVHLSSIILFVTAGLHTVVLHVASGVVVVDRWKLLLLMTVDDP